MKVITIKQPWASHIAFGQKRVENRTWRTSYRGPILIHAGRGFDAHAPMLAGVSDLRANSSGAIIGVAELFAVVSADEALDMLPQSSLQFVEGEFCWLLRDVRPLKTPLPMNGRLGLWEYQITDEQLAP
jgi:hypothetical protein